MQRREVHLQDGAMVDFMARAVAGVKGARGYGSLIEKRRHHRMS